MKKLHFETKQKKVKGFIFPKLLMNCIKLNRGHITLSAFLES